MDSVLAGMAVGDSLCSIKENRQRKRVKGSRTAMPKAKNHSQVPTEQVTELLLDAPEVSVFMTCGGLVNELRGLERTFERGEINESILLEKSKAVLAALRTAVLATERFDIVSPVTSDGQFSPFFWRWFNWWEDYFKGLTVTQIGELERLARERLAIVNDHRPTGHWIHYADDPDRSESWLIALGESLWTLSRYHLLQRKRR